MGIACTGYLLYSFEYLIIYIDILNAIHQFYIGIYKDVHWRLYNEQTDYQSSDWIEYRQFKYKSKDQPQ